MHRTLYLDNLRVFACFSVILFHISGICGFQLDIQNEYNVIMTTYHYSVSWCVPVFLMISGALFLNPNRKVDIRILYTHNIFRVIVAFIFWSFIYACYNFIGSEDPNRANGFIVHMVRGHFHMWFLFLIVGLYILTPLLRLITVNRKLTEYFLIVSFIVSFIIPFFGELLDLCLPNNRPYDSLLRGRLDGLYLQVFHGYICYYISGFYLHKEALSKRVENFIMILGVAVWIVIACFTFFLFRQTGFCEFYAFDSLLVLLESITVFLCVKRYFSDKIPIVGAFYKYSFGIYLVHMLVIYAFLEFGMTPTVINPILGIPLLSILVFLVSSSVIMFLYRIPIVNKWVV